MKSIDWSDASQPFTWIVVAASVLLFIPGNASSETQSRFTTFHFTSPKASEIQVSDTATLDELLEILRSNDIQFSGPHEITIDVGKYKGELVGYTIKLELTTYNPGGPTDPHCPYKQITNIWYDKDGRLEHYDQVVLPACLP